MGKRRGGGRENFRKRGGERQRRLKGRKGGLNLGMGDSELKGGGSCVFVGR